jgi:hypothetical protein
MLSLPYACPRHREAFIEAAKRGGCRDLSKMDEIRRKVLAWLSAKYPRAVLDHYNEKSCLACKLEASGFDMSRVRRAVIEMSKSLAPDEVR